LSWAGDVYAVPWKKNKSKTSCTIMPGKFTVSDQIEYHFGVIAGQNIATINSTQGSSQDIITGLMMGVSYDKFDPKGVTTRAQAATVQIRLLEILNMIDK
jgi:hypothetical protein